MNASPKSLSFTSVKSQKEAGFGNKESLYERLQSTRVPSVASDFEKSRGDNDFDKRIKLVAVSDKTILELPSSPAGTRRKGRSLFSGILI
ncbi:hypothetical protein Peur_032342 [Populus x canadensis]